MRELLIVSLSLLGLVAFGIFFVWRFVFKKSVRKMIFTMLGILQDRDQLVDPDAEIMPSREKHSSDVLEEKAVQFKQQLSLEQKRVPPKANLPSDDRADETSDNGWPRELDYETRHQKHPFRSVHLQTDNEQTHELMDIDTYNPPEAEADSQTE